MAPDNQGKSTRRDSGTETVNYKMPRNQCIEPYDGVVAGDSARHDSIVDVECISAYTLKRMLSDVNFGWSDASGKAVKKGRYNRDTTKSSMKQLQRVLCPFFVENPDMDAHRVSCYNKGFNEMARLKQHLVKEHKVPSKRLDYFKDKSFRDLASLEAKWVRVYCTLFPKIAKEKVPSPYKSAVSFLQPITTPSVSPVATPSTLEDVISQQGLGSRFESEQVVVSPNKHSKLLDSPIKSLPTPPSSAETSPELDTSEICPILDFDSLFPLPATAELLENDFTDPLLFAYQGINPLPSQNDTTQNFSGSPSHSNYVAEHPLNICFDCLSTNVFRTTGRGPSIDVCGDCHSTDIEYRLLSGGPTEVPRSTDTCLKSVMTTKGESCPTLGSFESMMAAKEVSDLNMDEWICPQDSYDTLLGDNENSKEDFNMLFDF